MKPATLLIVVMIMCFFLLVLGGGGYFLTREKDEDDEEGEECEGSDKNGVYEYDADGNCVKMGCTKGYYSQNNMCIKRRDYSGESSSGENSVDCQLDPNTPYNFGFCTDSTGQQLTGDIGSCGKGTRQKTPNIIKGSIGTNASCPSSEYVECEVPCNKVCKAPDELWVPAADAKCMAGTQVLGEQDGDGITYCGEGTQMKKLDESKIVTGDMTMDEYQESINFSACTSTTLKPCNIECTPGMQSVSCPVPVSDLGWSYEENGTVYTKKSAQQLFEGKIDKSSLVIEPSISRQYAIDKRILIKDSNGAWTTVDSKIPKGYKIKFKSSSEYTTEELRKKGCSIFRLEEAQAPRTRTNATWTKVSGECYEVGCGQMKRRNITWTLDKSAWGGGSDTSPSPSYDICKSQSPSCCHEDYVGQWEPIPGYDGCTNDGKRISTRKGNENLCSEPNRKEVSVPTCNYDCKLTGITLGDSVVGQQMIGRTGNLYFRAITNQVTRASKGTGRACEALSAYRDTKHLEEAIQEKFNSFAPDLVLPKFSCGQNAWVRGKKYLRNGTNCGPDGNGYPQGPHEPPK